jgi:hypothetical protein
MRRDKKWLTHAAPRGFKLPERTRRRPDVKATRGDGTYWVNLYRKIREKNLWVKIEDRTAYGRRSPRTHVRRATRGSTRP